MKHEQTTYTCDIYGERKAIHERTRIVVCQGSDPEDHDAPGMFQSNAPIVIDATVDLSQAGLDRLVRFINRGLSRPAKGGVA